MYAEWKKNSLCNWVIMNSTNVYVETDKRNYFGLYNIHIET